MLGPAPRPSLLSFCCSSKFRLSELVMWPTWTRCLTRHPRPFQRRLLRPDPGLLTLLTLVMLMLSITHTLSVWPGDSLVFGREVGASFCRFPCGTIVAVRSNSTSTQGQRPSTTRVCVDRPADLWSGGSRREAVAWMWRVVGRIGCVISRASLWRHNSGMCANIYITHLRHAPHSRPA